MKSVFFREQQRYTQIEIIEKFGVNHVDAISVMKRLKEFGVLKTVEASETQKDLTDLIEEDIEISDIQDGENRFFYVFTYVGILVLNDFVIKCYPKYIKSKTEPNEELKEVLRVIDKFNKREEVIHLYNEAYDATSFNKLALILAILRDYYEYGVYNNSENLIETNGNGTILWDKTVNETFALLSNNRPFYPEIYTRKTVNDELDYFKRLHERIITKCSEDLIETGLLDMFDMAPVFISDEEWDVFGDEDYILNRIYKELSTQFNNRKQRVLKMMYAYVSNADKRIDDIDCFSVFGVNKYHVVWEKICASILSDQLHMVLGDIDLPIPLQENYDKNRELIELIEKPKWHSMDNMQVDFAIEASNTLIPDIITIEKNSKSSRFMIYDAKYYNLQLEKGKKLLGQPGIESVTKQYLYQLAYKKFIEDHKIDDVVNCFLMPTEEDFVIKKGYVNLEMMDSLNLEHIVIRLVPAKMVYSAYLSDRTITSEELLL